MIAAGVFLILAYLVGSIPFGVVIARRSGVDLQAVGSGNIGATNAWRNLGPRLGSLVFLLDFMKGALPTYACLRLIAPEYAWFTEIDPSEWVVVGVAAAALLGHLFPIYLKGRGGKGVAVGAGVALALAPVPFLVALITWLMVVLATRTISVGSIAAAFALALVRLCEADALTRGPNIITGFVTLGSLLVIVKHHSNIRNLIQGTERVIQEFTMRSKLLEAIYLLALGLTFGGSFFFNFVAAPAIFQSFKEVVEAGPSDRTAGVAIVPADSPAETKAALASALAGSAVGPIFPRYFTMQIVGLTLALVTVRGFAGHWPKWNLLFLSIAHLLAIGGVFVSQEVSRLRIERFSPEEQVRLAAKEQFGPVHLVSLAMSAVGTLASGAALATTPRRTEPML